MRWKKIKKLSIQAISWALKLELQKSSEKFILVCLCNYADEDGICYPSITTLEKNTCQDRKTIISGLKSLCEAGLLQDTGRRVGATGGVIVYRVLGMPTASATHYVYRVTDQNTCQFYIGKRSFVGDPEQDTYRGSGRWTRDCLKAGVHLVREVLSVWPTSEEALAEEQRLFRAHDNDPHCMNDGLPSKLRILSSTKKGTVPFLPQSSTVFPTKQSQISVEAVPKTVHRSVTNHQIEPSSNHPSASKTPTRGKRVSRETKSDPEWWLDFKLAYPNRAGDHGWRKAQRAAHARQAEGHTPDEFIAGAQRYAAFCEAQGKLGSEYVKQACTFLGPDKPFLLPWTPAPTKADVRLNSNLSAADEFMRRTENAA